MDKRTIIFIALVAGSFFLINQWFGPKELPQKSAKPIVEQIQTPVATPKPPSSSESAQEQFFVLENGYQQLVFSTIGGALSEINLPFRNKENPENPVLPIDFDRAMKENYPYDNFFPAFAYQVYNGSSLVKADRGTLGGYYPLLRRSIIGPKKEITFRTPPQLYALNVVAEDGSLEGQVYQLKKLEQNFIEFELSQSQRRIVKTFTFSKDPNNSPYCVEVSVKVEGDARGLWLTSGVPEVELISGSAAPTLKYRMTRGKKSQVEQISLPKTSTSFSSIEPDWVANSNGFFGMILDPLSEIGGGFRTAMIPGLDDPTRISLIDAHYDLYPADKYPGYEIQLPLKAQTNYFRFYAGPFEDDILKKVDAAYSDPTTGYNPDYLGAMSFHGWFSFISEPFAKFLFILMKLCYKLTSSWGISIILLTLALRLMLYPLNAWSIKSTLRMQEIAPKTAAIQEKFKKDPKRAQMEIMNLYKEKGVNPLSGCFPLLIQLPFLIGMFDLLKSTFELRGAPFIPGWINNLTAPDVLFSWNYPLIFFGTDFHLLPFLLGAVMYLQQRFSSPLPKNKAMLTDQQKQQKMMGNIMTIVFTVMFYHFPSGLNIYWLSSMALGILQQWWMTGRLKDKAVVTIVKK
jgi:YidC/Oxa1 family membrane protein insertase